MLLVWVAYSIQAEGPDGPGYRLTGSPVSCRQLEADAGNLNCTRKTDRRCCLLSDNFEKNIFTSETSRPS